MNLGSALKDPKDSVTKIKMYKRFWVVFFGFFRLVGTSNLKMSYKSRETDGTTAKLA